MSDKCCRATFLDLERLIEIRAAVLENQLLDPSRATPESYSWFILNSEIWTWKDGSIIKGFAAADVRDGSIWALFVDPQFEGHGIGRSLLNAACGTLRKAGYTQARLTTARGTRAERFYRADGWSSSEATEDADVIFTKAI